MTETLTDFFYQSYLSYKALYGWITLKAFVLTRIILPLIRLMFFCYVAMFINGYDNLAPYILGNALMLCTATCINGLGNVFLIDRQTGTLNCVLLSQKNRILFFIQKSLIGIFISCISVIIDGIVMFSFWRISILNIDFLGVFTILLVAVFATSCLGILLGIFGLIISETNILLNVINMVLLIFSGCNFPVESLPGVLQCVSFVLPLYRSVSAIKVIMSGGRLDDIIPLLLAELLVGIFYLILASQLLSRVEKEACKGGTLNLI